jgi:hypothetical protein
MIKKYQDKNTNYKNFNQNSTKIFNKKIAPKEEGDENIPKKMKCYKWVIGVKEKDIEYSQEERENVYQWVIDSEHNTRKMDNDGKIRFLYNKWLRVQNNDSDNGVLYCAII